MKKRLTLLTALICSASTLTAQKYESYDLSKYKLPDVERHQLDLSVMSNGDMSTENDYRKVDVMGDLDAMFKSVRIKELFMGEHNAIVFLDGQYNNLSKKEDPNGFTNFTPSTQKGLSLTMQYSNRSRFYLKERDKWFIETGGSATFHYNTSEATGNDEQSVEFVTTDIGIPISVGRGRLEQVTEARQAVYIVENLHKQGVLKRELSDAEITELATIASKVKNKRFLDSRLRHIEELQEIDNFFRDKGLLRSEDASYFATLVDYWQFGDRFERLAGTEYYAGLDIGYSSQSYKYFHQEITNEYNSAYLSATVGLRYEKPVNLYWQHSAHAELKAYTDNEDQFYQLVGGYSWGYYPTSRTNIDFGVKGEVASDNDEHAMYEMMVSASLFTDIYYYFSPQLRLKATASYIPVYGLQSGAIENVFSNRFMFNVGINYAFF